MSGWNDELSPKQAYDRLRETYEAVFYNGKVPQHDDDENWEGEAESRIVELVQLKLGSELENYAPQIYWSHHAELHLPWTLETILHRRPGERGAGSQDPLRLEYGQQRSRKPLDAERDPQAMAREQGERSRRVLLLMAGYSTEQLALCIAAHIRNGCHRIVPFSSDWCWREVKDTVLKHLIEDLGFKRVDDQAVDLREDKFWLQDHHDPVQSENPADVFRALITWVRGNPDALPAIDCTGGQKPMDSGATQAASFWGLPAYYLGFDEYDEKLRVPKPYSCRYQELELPDASFSLATRRAIRDKFESCDFESAYTLALQMTFGAYGALYRSSDSSAVAGAMPQRTAPLEELPKLICATKRIRECVHWAHLDYAKRSLKRRSPRLHGYFEDLNRKRVDGGEVELDKVITDLFRRDHRWKLLDYVVDEYWRLTVMLDNLHQIRDVQIGAVGLVELIVDSLFYLPWFESAKISDERESEFVAFYEPTTGDRPPERNDKRISNSSFAASVRGKHFPRHLLPPAIQRDKIELLKKGKRSLLVWLPLDSKGQPSLDPTCERPTERKPRVEAKVEVVTDKKLLGISGSKWADEWQYPYNSWVARRHKVAHLRVPINDPEARRSLQEDAMTDVVPRFIQILFLATESDQEDLPIDLSRAKRGARKPGNADDFVTWWSQPKWTFEKRVPWANQLPQLTRDLCLPDS